MRGAGGDVKGQVTASKKARDETDPICEILFPSPRLDTLLEWTLKILTDIL